MNTKHTQIDTIMNSVGNSFFTVVFIKADGSERAMNAMRGCHKPLKGGNSTIKNRDNLVSVYDVKTKAYRCFNKDTVKEIRALGKVYKFQN